MHAAKLIDRLTHFLLELTQMCNQSIIIYSTVAFKT